MTKDVLIERVDASTIRVYTSDAGINEDIYQHFVYEKPGFVKNRYSSWDGRVKLFSKKNGKLPYGCLQNLIELLNKNKCTYDLDQKFSEDVHPIDEKYVDEWIESLELSTKGQPIKPYDYQRAALITSIKSNRRLFLAATSAGKSLAVYMMSLYKILHNTDERILIIVPTVDLVNQMYDDMLDYSCKLNIKMSDYTHKIYEGQPRYTDKPIIISTYQSLNQIIKYDADYFLKFSTVIVDEVHQAKAESFNTILGACKNAYGRYGLTGTLDNVEVAKMQCIALIGPVERLVTAKELIDAGTATKLNITLFRLKYDLSERIHISNLSDYAKEKEYLMNHDYRNFILKTLISTLPKVTLVIFDRIEHIESFNDYFKRNKPDKKVFVIHGQVDIDERKEIKQAIEQESDVIFLASEGTMSTGVSIKNLHNLVFAKAGGKSLIKTLQTIGRMMRLHSDKVVANVYDVIDDLEHNGWENYTYRHGVQRYTYYKQEGHPISLKEINVKAMGK